MRLPLALSLGLALGAVTSSVSCGTAPRCTATSCPTGCCDTSGRCQPGGSSSACGSRGGACSTCGVTASCVAGTCMQNISGTGGGSAATGGGSAATGGGSAAGGSAGTGGGSSAGGSAGTGGGSSAGGSAGTGGGASAGGSAGTGGGSGGGGGTTAAQFCTRYANAQNRFFAGRTTCGSPPFELTNDFNASMCLSGYGSCSAGDRQTLDMATTCIEMATICTSGNDQAAIMSISSCLAIASDTSQACQNALFGQ